MGRRRIKKDADQDIQPDEKAPHAKKRLQKIHFSSHPLGGCPFAADFRKIDVYLLSWTGTCHDPSTIDYERLPIRPTLRTVVSHFDSY